MSALEAFERIVTWYASASAEEVKRVQVQQQPSRIDEIQTIMGEVVPPDIATLFAKYDGDGGEGDGAFLGHGFMSLEKVAASLDFSKSLVKPRDPVVEDPAQSAELLDAIIAVHIEAMNRHRDRWRRRKPWHKLEFTCSPGSYGGPYLYAHAKTTEEEREIVELPKSVTDRVYNLSARLHALEHAGYNWDQLNFTVHSDGTSKVNRVFFQFEEEGNFTSNPLDAIRLKYFHIKWLPIIEDYGGNFIGIDLDPGPAGTRGQIIVFGRDEDDMYVMAQSWGAFLEMLLFRIDSGGQEFLGDVHLHDLFKPQAGPSPSPTPNG